MDRIAKNTKELICFINSIADKSHCITPEARAARNELNAMDRVERHQLRAKAFLKIDRECLQCDTKECGCRDHCESIIR